MRKKLLGVVVVLVAGMASGCVEDKHARAGVEKVRADFEAYKARVGRTVLVDIDPQLSFSLRDAKVVRNGYSTTVQFGYLVKQGAGEDLGLYTADVTYRVVDMDGKEVLTFSDFIKVRDGVAAGVSDTYIASGGELIPRKFTLEAVEYDWWLDNTKAVVSSVSE